MGFIECLFLRQHNINMTIAFAIIDLFDDLQANPFILLDIAEPIIKFGPELTSDDLIQKLLWHHL